MLAGSVLEEALLRAVGRCAREARQVEQHWDLCARLQCLGRQVQVEGHVSVGARRLVLELEQLAPEGGDGACGLERHDESSGVVGDEGGVVELEAWCRGVQGTVQAPRQF